MTRALALAAIAFSLAACGEEASTPADEPLTSIAGVSIAGETYTVSLESSVPDPPIRGNTNAWRFSLLAGDAPMADCTFVVEPTMPAHGHGTTPDPEVTPIADTPGAYDVRPINFSMPGEWHVAIRPTCGSVSDEIVVIVDIES